MLKILLSLDGKLSESDKNRYWLVNDLLDQRYEDYISFYRYHRLGLDLLGEEPDDARFEITESIEGLKSIYRNNSSAFILKIFFDAKIDEIVNIYSEAFPNEKARIVKTLLEIDPSNSTKYQLITQEKKDDKVS